MKKSTKKKQLRVFYNTLRRTPMTTKMLEVETGIQRANLTRYVSYYRDRGLIAEVKKAPCPITKHQATFYSTNPRHLPKEKQAEMFENKRWSV